MAGSVESIAGTMGFSGFLPLFVWRQFTLIGAGPTNLLDPAQPAGKTELQQRSEDWYTDHTKHPVVPAEVFIPD